MLLFNFASRGMLAMISAFSRPALFALVRLSSRRDNHYGCETTPARERGLPLLAGVGAAAALVTSTVSDVVPRVLGFRLGAGWVFNSAAPGIVDPAEVFADFVSIGALRPSPSCLAITDRRSE